MVVQNHSRVKRFHVHQLRHMFGCPWFEAGDSLATLQEFLSHSTIVTTQRCARLVEGHVQAEAKRIQGRLAPLAPHPTNHTPAKLFSRTQGGVAERSKAAVLKTARAQALVGSNPTPSSIRIVRRPGSAPTRGLLHSGIKNWIPRPFFRG
jgi:hypothetical protein